MDPLGMLSTPDSVRQEAPSNEDIYQGELSTELPRRFMYPILADWHPKADMKVI